MPVVSICIEATRRKRGRMKKPTFWKNLLLMLRQTICKHKVLIVAKTHECENEMGFECWCEKCDSTLYQIYYQKESEEE